MSYLSPIELVMGQMNTSLEGAICTAIQNVGVIVDRDELVKALRYDRNQYQKGYKDRDVEIVRCRDCKHGVSVFDSIVCKRHQPKYRTQFGHDPDWFCADGERME